ncbi:MAG: ATP-binding protein [Myxococcaceae bacterium]
MDPRISRLLEAAEDLAGGRLDAALPEGGDDEVSRLSRALGQLRGALRQTEGVQRALLEVTARINSGLLLDEVLDHVYGSFRSIIPYDRIGFATVDKGGRTVTSLWDRSEAKLIKLGKGYTAPLEGSSLQRLLVTGHPRILNDLPAYLAQHPGSEATRLIVEEGMRSSLTCPLVTKHKQVGFLFFSSMTAHTYARAHVESFQQIAGQIAVTVEKGRLMQELVAANDLKNRLLGMASHDLRHPLTVISGYIGLLGAGALGPLTASQGKVLKIVEANAKGMVRLIEDLLDVSAIEAGQLDLQPTQVDLLSCLSACLASNVLLADAKGMRLELDPGVPAGKVRLDAKRIEQVLGNLISNAVKFSHPGTTVRVGAREGPGELVIYVSDEGQGIPQEELPKVFTDFGRTSVRPTGDERSTGLGLAIVKRIVEAHGGRVWVEATEVGEGSTFAFALPLG